MIETRTGDLFESKAQTLVNTINTVGVMGKGIALEFKKRFPEMFDDYLKRVREGKVQLGEPYLFTRPQPPWIINFPTKRHWREVSHISDIVKGLGHLERHYRGWGITSLAVPPLGCGQGGLEWRVVGPTLYEHLQQLQIPVVLYAPHGTPREQLSLSFLESGSGAVEDTQPERPRINPAWVALVEVLARIEREKYHWPIGRISFQKLAYFATESGLPTGFHYEKRPYGPFAPDLKAAISKLADNGLIIEKPLGETMIQVRVGPTFERAIKNYRADLAKWDEIIAKVTDLFLRVRQTRQAELAATVHFAARHLARPSTGEPSEADVFHAVKEWKIRRDPPFRDDEIAHAIRHLNVLDWLELRPSRDLPLPDESAVGA